ncbi:FAD-dependent oxidoreductase [Novosphingobium sp. KCTC 2891]|uniref:NAD(P)/FAD-dependent oxidoreductase n=1 Tax=Novosphingobium sp. KCTC 2891 TaxID=2989730 RepID=UPI002221D0D0|nr:FAD-dependent oxidoreductase [Novosphingobium sp. KCTC 2891]MCW1381615.1 FAD-dependent oxidoreductase [Novosphingobium sp. KCTC 2891]
MSPKIAIIGAGIAGLACAEALSASGAHVRLFDKGRGPGGRLSTRRVSTEIGEASFDHGAQYFTARDALFARHVEDWSRAGIVARWPEAGADAWVGVPGMNALPRHLAQQLDIAQGAFVRGMARKADGWHLLLEGSTAGPFDHVVVALPAEQAASLLGLSDLAMARAAVRCPSEPCWAGMFAFPEPLAGPPILRDRGPIAWAARNSAKPGRQGPEAWIVHASPAWSRAHLENPADAVAAALLEALAQAVGTALPPPLSCVAHRWRYARSGDAGTGFLWNEQLGLGACGDWLGGPRVEQAWLSGHQLGGAIAAAAFSTDSRVGAAAR